MARAKNADSAATCERILAAARGILASHGLDGLSVRRVARDAALSAGTVSYYFSSHEALWEACLDSHYERLDSLVQRHIAAAAAGAPLRQVLDAAVRDLYAFAVEERVMIRLQMLATARQGSLREGRQRTRQLLFDRAGKLPSTTLTPLAMQTVAFAAVRYAAADDEERRSLTGCDDNETAHRLIADHLVDVALRLFAQAD